VVTELNEIKPDSVLFEIRIRIRNKLEIKPDSVLFEIRIRIRN
jgi:hypothetical protein